MHNKASQEAVRILAPVEPYFSNPMKLVRGNTPGVNELLAPIMQTKSSLGQAQFALLHIIFDQELNMGYPVRVADSKQGDAKSLIAQRYKKGEYSDAEVIILWDGHKGELPAKDFLGALPDLLIKFRADPNDPYERLFYMVLDCGNGLGLGNVGMNMNQCFFIFPEDFEKSVDEALAETLTKRERIIVYKHIWEQTAFDAIGKEMSCSATRVSQMLNKALHKLRRYTPLTKMRIGKKKYAELRAAEREGEKAAIQKRIEEEKASIERAEKKKIRLTDMGLTPRTYNCLARYTKCTTAEDVAKLTDETLMSLRGFGDASYKELIGKLEELGLRYPVKRGEGATPVPAVKKAPAAKSVASIPAPELAPKKPEPADTDTSAPDKAAEKKPKEKDDDDNILREKAQEGCFVRDMSRNIVYCPNGSVLQQKLCKYNGNTIYYNKKACQYCENTDRCLSVAEEGKWKEIEFPKGAFEQPCPLWNIQMPEGDVEDAVDNDEKDKEAIDKNGLKTIGGWTPTHQSTVPDYRFDTPKPAPKKTAKNQKADTESKVDPNKTIKPILMVQGEDNKDLPIDDRIRIQNDNVLAAKALYESELQKLDQLKKEKRTLDGQEILKAFVDSDKDLAEVLAFLKSTKTA